MQFGGQKTLDLMHKTKFMYQSLFFFVNENRVEGLHTYFETKNHSSNSYSGKVNLSGSSGNSLYLYGYAPFYRMLADRGKNVLCL